MKAPEAPPPLREPHLVDSTVWSKARSAGRPDLAEWFNRAALRDLVVTCDAVILELLRCARNSADFSRQADLLALLPAVPMGRGEWSRAHEVQAALATQGKHRGVPPIDMLIAAAAETAGLPLLHYDHDFDLIAGVTGQACPWLVPAGTLP